MGKHYLDVNVYDAANDRIKYIIGNFKTITVAFSGGKDSGVMLNLVADYCKKNNVNKKINVLFLDYEVQYSKTINYVEETFKNLPSNFEVLHVCLPFCVSTATSAYQQYWRPWDPDKKELWTREMPENVISDPRQFDFWNDGITDYEFQSLFNKWVGDKNNDSSSIVLIGIRADESYVRYIRAVTENNKYKGKKFILEMKDGYFQGFPIYDWSVEDIWAANAKMNWTYNDLYNLYYRAGLSVSQMRVASPFLSYGHGDLELYKAIEPDLWSKMLGRVNGVNFAGIYGNTTAMGWKNLKLPAGHTWKSFLKFLIDTLPKESAEEYKRMFKVSEEFWQKKGGVLEDDTLKQLKEKGYKFTTYDDNSYNSKKKRAVFEEYPDDMEIANFKSIPSYKRMVVTILRNDRTAKYMGFSQTKDQLEKRKAAIKRYEDII